MSITPPDSAKDIRPGKSARRLEDHRFLTGSARYTADLNRDDQLYAVVIRSDHAHAEILAIDASAALEIDGVKGVHTVADLDADGLGSMPCPTIGDHLDFFIVPPRPALARGRVRHVGDPVALVIAETLATAKAGAEQVFIEYEILPALANIEATLSPNATLVWEQAPSNAAFRFKKGDKTALNDAFAKAEHVVELDIVNNRVTAVAMEPRAGIGEYDIESDTYTLTCTAQGLHSLRNQLANDIFGIDANNFRIRAPDVGGGFGLKNFLYPEWVLLPWAARFHARAVKWVAERSEDFSAAVHGRDSRAHAALALSAEGKFLALKAELVGNMGAYLSGGAPGIPTKAFPTALGGFYNIGQIYIDAQGVFTNTAPVDAYRGAGKPEANFITERLIETAAKRLNLDPVELRRQNTIDEFPHTTALGMKLDSGRYKENISEAERLSGRDGFETRRNEATTRGRLRGLGFACFMETARSVPEEGAEVIFADDGKVELRLGTESNGQGHETSFSQIATERLGLSIDTFRFINADTQLIRMGHGHGGARSMHMGGAALVKVLDAVMEKALVAAAQYLQVAPKKIKFSSGVFTATDNGQSIALLEMARTAKGELDTFSKVEDAAFTFPGGCHAAEVEIDPQTGAVALLRYTAVDDYGNLINPRLAEGQVVGGVTQGIGQAIGEHALYAPDTAQLISGSMIDYLVPRAEHLPEFNIHLEGSATKANPLGVKGTGQAGAIAAPQTIVNAVLGALSPLGIEHIDMPLTSEAIWCAIQRARAA